MLIEQQEIAARRERAQAAVARILARPDGDVYGDYQIRSSSKRTYRVAMRGPGLFDNYCSCPDFAVNTLGTCKHIEALLLMLRLGRRHGEAVAGKFSRTRASLSLHYGESLGVRLRLPSSPSPALQALAREYFDESGLLKSSRLRDFEKLMDELRRADDQAVVYSDVLDYIDRENEIAEGLDLEHALWESFGTARTGWPTYSRPACFRTRYAERSSRPAEAAWFWPMTWDWQDRAGTGGDRTSAPPSRDSTCAGRGARIREISVE